MFHGAEVVDVVFVVLEKVDFIDYDYGGDAIGLGRSEEPIDECGGGLSGGRELPRGRPGRYSRPGYAPAC